MVVKEVQRQTDLIIYPRESANPSLRPLLAGTSLAFAFVAV